MCRRNLRRRLPLPQTNSTTEKSRLPRHQPIGASSMCIIVLSSELVGEFKRLWRLYIGEQNTGGSIFVAEGLAMDIPHSYPFKCSIENPYYHLQHEPFWRLVKNEKGKERKFYSSLKSLRDVFAYAEIDQELYDLMVNRESAVILEYKLRELV